MTYTPELTIKLMNEDYVGLNITKTVQITNTSTAFVKQSSTPIECSDPFDEEAEHTFEIALEPDDTQPTCKHNCKGTGQNPSK